MTEAAASAGPSSKTAQTLLTQLQALSQPSLALPPAFLHPYAPLPGNGGAAGWKGKGKAVSADSVEAQLEVVRSMRLSVELAKTRLSLRDGDWGKLSRALKEVVSHQNTLLPLVTSLNPAFLRTANTSLLPSSRVALPPVQLLPALAQSQDIQTYHEESQFGLLKSTLTLAGNCFVIDIDLETDAAAEEDESAVPTPAFGNAAPDSAGCVRLSKIAVSYVTRGGGMEGSDYVAGVLRLALEAYLGEWNSVVEGLLAKGERGKRLEKCIRRIDGLLAEVKALDGAVQVEGTEAAEDAGFAGLEAIAKRVGELRNGESPVYALSHPTVLPSFTLYPSGDSIANPAIRIRPRQSGEKVPVPRQHTPSGGDEPQPASGWLLEVVPEPRFNGIIVRRSWLGEPEGTDNPWDGGIKVENLLYSPKPTTGSQINPFPYASTFVHRPAAAGALEQHWSLASPGPDGYVVGRLGLPESDDDLRLIFESLRKQIKINQMFLSIFDADSISAQGDQEDEDKDMEDLLSGMFAHVQADSAAPTAVPITIYLSQTDTILESPLPHYDGPGTTLRLQVDCSSGGGTVAAEIIGEGASEKRRAMAQTAVDGIQEANLVDIYKRVEGALRA